MTMGKVWKAVDFLNSLSFDWRKITSHGWQCHPKIPLSECTCNDDDAGAGWSTRLLSENTSFLQQKHQSYSYELPNNVQNILK